MGITIPNANGGGMELHEVEEFVHPPQ